MCLKEQLIHTTCGSAFAVPTHIHVLCNEYKFSSMSQHRFLMLCYGARLSEPFVPYTQQKGTVITMKENQEKKSKLSGLGATLQLGNKPLWKERVSYFFVNLGNIPIMTMVNAYLSIFYTDTLGMDAKVVGTMFLIARVFDGVNDPFIGYFIDRAPNSKFGKFRRILIVGTIICTLNYAVVWMGPAYVSDSMKVMVAYISYMLLGVTFPVMDISLTVCFL